MSFTVERKIEICKQNNNRPGCCWYLCDDRDEKICGKCFSCFNNCPHGVYEIIQGDPYPLNQEKCVGCRICLEMCPNRAIEVNAIVENAIESHMFPLNKTLPRYKELTGEIGDLKKYDYLAEDVINKKQDC